MSGALWDSLDAAHRTLLERAVREADRRGHALYLVGGPVRDWLLDQPLRDLDLLVDAGPDVVKALAECLEDPARPASFHPRFGTGHIEREGAGLDLASVRREHYARPGALPSVEPATIEEDLRRRDFSVNAMAIPLSRTAQATLPEEAVDMHPILDLEGGRGDLARGVLRILHPRSFHDDPTRALRAGRLAARLGFRLARGTRNALDRALQDDAMSAVSGDRIRREFEHLFADAALGVDPVRALVALERWGVLDALCPGVSIPRPVRPALRRLGRAVALPPWELSQTRTWLVALAIWCEGLGLSTRRGLVARLSLRGAQADLINMISRGARAELARSERARGRGALDRELRTHSAEALLALYAKAGAPLRHRMVRWVAEDRGLRIPVTGRDIKGFGLEGPAIGSALQALRSAWLDNKIGSRDEALVFAREWAQQAERRRKRKSAGTTKTKGRRLPSGK